MKILDEFIEEATNNINTIGITDPISEEYLKEICENYHILKTGNKILCVYCNKELTNKLIPVYDENWYQQPGIYQCKKCFESDIKI